MSDLTPCNFCSLRTMRTTAQARGVKVIVKHEPDGWISARYSDREEPSAWFMELTTGCVC